MKRLLVFSQTGPSRNQRGLSFPACTRFAPKGLFLALACLGPTLGCGSSTPGGGADAGNPRSDAAVACGNGTVDTSLGETCDTAISSGAGACPTSCPSSGNACNPNVLKNAGTCTAACAAEAVTACKDGDGCCAAGCTAQNDSDCASCGNGKVDTDKGETCDTAIPSGTGACPATCPSSGDSCSTNALKNAATCTAVCAAEKVTVCKGGDGCCPSGCTSADDSDCNPLADTTGTWFSYTSAPGTLKTSLGATYDVTINSWVRSYTSPAGDIKFNICKLQVSGKDITTTYGQKVINTFQTSAHTDEDLQVPVNSSITLPKYVIYSGQTADGKDLDTVPPPFPGGDGDQKKGVTIPTAVTLPLLGTQSFNVYAGLVITTTMSDVKATSETTKEGNTSVTTHGVVFDSDNQILSPTGSTFDATFKDGSVSFTSTRLADGDSDTYSCDYLAQHYP